MSVLHLLLQAASTTTAPAGGGGMFGSQGMSSFLMIGLVVVVFYFFMMRPQMKKQKEQNNFLSEIGKGTKIVTIGGICGKVLEVRAKSFLIEVEGGNRLQILKSAISLENSKAFNAETEEVSTDKKD
jgi:preprotein translocase subunit YajC